MAATVSIVESIIPWVWLVLGAILYHRIKTSHTLIILISLFMLAVSDIVSYHSQVFFIHSYAEGEVQNLISSFLIFGRALHALGLLFLTAGVVWFVRYEVTGKTGNT